MRVFLSVLLVSLALGGCASKPKPFGGAPSLQVYRQEALPAPSATDFVKVEGTSLIGPYDKLSVKVFGLEELSQEEVQADASGRISVPLAGSVQAGGRTTDQVAEEIAEKLRENHVRNPRVAVNLRDAIAQVITVGGEVKEPGVYPVTSQLTLLGAVSRAKGTTEFAKLDDVVVFRTVGGQRMAALYNIAAIRRGVYEDPRMYPNDVVMVGDSPGRRLFRDILQTAPSLLTPLIYVF